MREWRAFTDVEVDLDYPVVFFVAPNGVGKTSLYEAARCALFGFPTGRNAGQLVRGGAKRASVSVDLVLNGADIRVTRTLTPGGRTTFDAELEGQSLDESAFESLMTSSWTADRALIDRLVFGDSSPGSGSAPLPVRAHLADLLGVTPLLEAVDTLRAKQKSLATTISALREAEEDTAEASADAERKLATAREALDAAQSERTALSDRLESAGRAVTVAAAWERYRNEVTNYNGAVDALMSDIRDQISITSADPSEGLALARGQVERELEATRQAATEAEVAAAQAAGAADLLRSATDTCPTCLRPLSESERNHALHTHGEVASSAEQHTTEASQNSALVRDRLGVIEEFTRRLDRLQAPSPPELDDPGPSALTTLEELREQDRALAERVGEARANATAAETALNESRARATERNQLHTAAAKSCSLAPPPTCSRTWPIAISVPELSR